MRFLAPALFDFIHSLYVNVFALLVVIRATTAGTAATVLEDAESIRARKRLRIDSPVQTPASSSDFQPESIDNQINVNCYPAAAMRFSESDQDSLLSSSPNYTSTPGPSSAVMGNPGPSSSSNGYQNNTASMNGNFNGNNGYVAATNRPFSNGVGNGIHKTHGKSVMRVNLPGTMLYEDDESLIDREEFVRLVIQSLRDVGYS